MLLNFAYNFNLKLKHFFNFLNKKLNYTNKGEFKFLLIFLIFLNLIFKPIIILFNFLFYSIFILFFFNYIFTNKILIKTLNRLVKLKMKNISFLKINNNNCLSYYYLFFIFLFYLILTNNLFTLNLFKLYSNFKNNLKFLNSINLDSFINNNYFYKPIFKAENSYSFGFNQSRSFSSSSNISNNNINDSDPFEYDPEIENLTSSQLVELLPTDTNLRNKYFAYNKNKELKEFKKLYKGGYLGYTNVHHFSNVSGLLSAGITDLKIFKFLSFLISELDKYLNEIPENIIILYYLS